MESNIDWEDSLNIDEEFESMFSDSSGTSSSESMFNSFFIGDIKTLQEWNEIVNYIKKQYFVYVEQNYVDEHVESELIAGEDFKYYDDDHTNHTIDKFYIDALDAAEKNLSEVKLLWTRGLCQYKYNENTIPESYSTTTNIEKVILLYAKNFIEQFKINYPNRRQLTLVLENECGLQKCVCTTIKPTRLVYCDLNDLTSYSAFVAKHVEYNSLEDPTIVPNKLFSPTTTLELQMANCFELATLLVSFLTGCQYNAFVVQGYASENICNNDLRKVNVDLPIDNFYHEKHTILKNIEDNNLDDTYAVEPPFFDLCTKYATFLIEQNKKIIDSEEKKKNASNSSDPLYGKRVHCWVIVMPLESEDKDEDIIKNIFFIEPSTGEQKEIADKNYIGIESVWNHTNYWVNLQPLNGGCMQYNYNLTNRKYWLNFLQNKPQSSPKMTLNLKNNNDEIARHIIMPNSWVNALEVPRNKYLMLYPNGKKIVLYMNAIKEYFADYIMPNGLIEKTTFYAKSDYMKKLFVKKTYKHRIDKLIAIEKKYTNKKIETIEYFQSGRKDCLRKHKFYGDSDDIQTKRQIKFYNVRLDSIVELNINADDFIILYKDRSDLLFWRFCELFDPMGSPSLNIKRKPVIIKEKYLRDESKHKDQDIATRNFNLIDNEIYVLYQYGDGQITQSSRLFKKPSRTSNDNFDPAAVIEDVVWPYENHLKPHKKYLMLQDMIKAENEALRDISKLEDDVIKILKIRGHERSEFKLKIDLLDWDQNHKIRELIQNKKEKKLRLAKRDKAKQIEYILPYFETIKTPCTYNEALHIRNKIINDYKQNAKDQFLRTKTLFTEKQFILQSKMKELENNDFKDSESKKNAVVMCSLLKDELIKLILKMKRLKETYTERYNDLVSSLNMNPKLKLRLA